MKSIIKKNKKLIMLYLKIFFAILLIIIIYTVIRTRIYIKKSVAIINATQKYERVIPNPTSTILFIGDSTAYGTGSSFPGKSVAGRFGEKYPNTTIINEGINGQKIHQLASQFIADVEKSVSYPGSNPNSSPYTKVDLLVIQIGGNDIIRFTPLSSIEEDLANLLESAKKITDNVIILHSGNVGVSPFFPRYLGWIWTIKSRQVRDLYIREAPKHNATYIDLFQESRDDTFSSNPQKYYAADLLHPSSDGYAIWFEKITAALKTKNFPEVL